MKLLRMTFLPVLIFCCPAFSQTLSTNTLGLPVNTGQCVASSPDDSFGWNGVCSCELDKVVRFGSSVSIDNALAAVAAEQIPAGCIGSGSVSVFEFSAEGGWQRQADLVSSIRVENDRFPLEMSISGNSVIASSGIEFPTSELSRYLTVFTLDDGVWSETQTIQTNSESFSHEGDTLVVNSSLNTPVGNLVVFNRGSDGIWREETEIETTGALTHFEVYGNTLVVASEDTEVLTIYERSAGAWQLQTQLNIPRGAISGPLNPFSQSSSLDVSADSIALVPGFVFNGALSTAYTFERTGAGLWVETTGVSVPDRDTQTLPSPHEPTGVLSPAGDKLLYLRDTYFDDPCCPEISRLMINREANLFLFSNTDEMWRLTDMKTFTTEEGTTGMTIYDTRYTADFDGTNIIVGTLSEDGTMSENTVLALSVDASGRFLPLTDDVAVDTSDNTDATNTVDSVDTVENSSSMNTTSSGEMSNEENGEGTTADGDSVSQGGGGTIGWVLFLFLMGYRRRVL